MRFSEAMKALEDGYAVRRIDLNNPLLPGDIEGSEYEADFSTEWELYSSPLSFIQVMQTITEGDRFQRKGWDSHVYFEMHGGMIFCERPDLTPEDFLANDYVFVGVAPK